MSQSQQNKIDASKVSKEIIKLPTVLKSQENIDNNRSPNELNEITKSNTSNIINTIPISISTAKTNICSKAKEEDDFDFVYTDEDLFNFINSQNASESKPKTLYPDKIKDYFKVTEVINSKREKILKCEIANQTTQEELSIINQIKVKLLGLWTEIIVDTDDLVFISAQYKKSENLYEISDSYSDTHTKQPETNSMSIVDSFIVVEPEILISPSRIKTAFPCYRKSIFNEQFKNIVNFQTSNNKELLIGSLIHEVFQSTFRKYSSIESEKALKNYIEDRINKLLQKYSLDIAIYDLNADEVEQLCKNYVTNIMKFFKEYFVKKMNINGIKVKNFVSCEQAYQSQVLGMKGVIDLLIETTNEMNQVETTPFELKTGITQNNSDLMQVLIYCLILSEQLSKNSYNGILVYIKRNSEMRIRVKKNEIINVIVVRNNIAKYLKALEQNHTNYKTYLPDLYNRPSECERCFSKDTCYSLYSNYEKVNEIPPKQDKLEDEQNKQDDVTKYVYNNVDFKDYVFDETTRGYFELFYELINQEECHQTNDNGKRETNFNEDGEDLSLFKCFDLESITDKGNSYELILTQRNINTLLDEDEVISQFHVMNDAYQIYERNSNVSVRGVIINRTDEIDMVTITLNVLKFHVNKTTKNGINIFSDSNVKHFYLKTIVSNSKYTFRLMRGNLLTMCRNANRELKELVVHHKQAKIDYTNRNEYKIKKFIIKYYY